MAAVTQTEHPHVIIVEGPGGPNARIKGTGMLVWILAALYNRGESPAGLQILYPHLSAAALYDALSYYFDHKAEIDQEIGENNPEQLFARLRDDPDWIETRPGSFRRREGFGGRR